MKDKQNGHCLFRKAAGWVITVILTALPLILLAWVMESGEPGLFLDTFRYVLSGRLFAEPWNPGHAGSVLDQPTIGKWYFVFTVFTALSLPCMALARQFGVRHSKIRRWFFLAGLIVLCLFLLCLLTIPFYWLIQYINAMGFTSKRIWGVLYGLAGYAAVLLFYAWAIKGPRTHSRG